MTSLKRCVRQTQLNPPGLQPQTSVHRIGIGTDRHRLVEGRPLILGGVTIPFERGCLAHSDGDALLHAITDAILGAASLGDIGEHFPDTDPAYRDADSAMLLQHALELVVSKGYVVVNIDCVISLQRPKLKAFKPMIRSRVAQLLAMAEDCVNVKAKTAEGLGPVGEGDAIDTIAIAMLRRVSEG